VGKSLRAEWLSLVKKHSATACWVKTSLVNCRAVNTFWIYRYVRATIHEMFSFFWMFKWFEMGDICIIQLTYSRVNRSGVYNALKSNAEHASRIYAICQWELCFPFRTQTTWHFVSQLIFLLEIRVDSWTRFGAKACMYFRFVFHMLQNNVYYFQTYPKAKMKMTDNLLRYSAV
jgi:hypothetical protein